MRRVAALLAAVLLATCSLACGQDGAEPGASRDATLVLDFQPNAVHAGIYSALRRGYYADEAVRLKVREPSGSTDAPKLLRAGRAQFAILDIHDLGIAREAGLDVIGVMPVVQRPLAAVLAQRQLAKRPRDLEGEQVGVTGLPSDDAVLDSIIEGDGGDPDKVKRTTIGFNAVADLAAGKLRAATGFWNAESVTLKREGIAIREFRVDDFGAPQYPELVMVTSARLQRDDPALVDAVVAATSRGYRFTVAEPGQSLDDLIASVKGVDGDAQAAQLRSLLPALSPVGQFNRALLEEWSRWDVKHGILKHPVPVSEAFRGVR